MGDEVDPTLVDGEGCGTVLPGSLSSAYCLNVMNPTFQVRHRRIEAIFATAHSSLSLVFFTQACLYGE